MVGQKVKNNENKNCVHFDRASKNLNRSGLIDTLSPDILKGIGTFNIYYNGFMGRLFQVKIDSF